MGRSICASSRLGYDAGSLHWFRGLSWIVNQVINDKWGIPSVKEEKSRTKRKDSKANSKHFAKYCANCCQIEDKKIKEHALPLREFSSLAT